MMIGEDVEYPSTLDKFVRGAMAELIAAEKIKEDLHKTLSYAEQSRARKANGGSRHASSGGAIYMDIGRAIDQNQQEEIADKVNKQQWMRDRQGVLSQARKKGVAFWGEMKHYTETQVGAKNLARAQNTRSDLRTP